MIKKIIIVLALMLTIFTGKADAQCPTEDFYQTTIEIQTSTCGSVKVKLCYRCPPTNLGEIRIIEIISAQNCLSDFPALLDEIRNIVSTWNFIQTNLCSFVPTVPCGGGQMSDQIFTYYQPACWYCEKIMYLGEVKLAYRTCENSPICIATIGFCILDNTVIRTVYATSYQPGVNCNLEPAEVQAPTQVGQTTPCFKGNTDCDNLWY